MIVRTVDDGAVVRLLDPESKELFAECPVTMPLHTCVERAIDSSRYFCIRIVDGATKKHAFIGLGFSTREPAGDFFGALVNHQQYIERKAKAEEMRDGKEGGGGRDSIAPLTGGVTLKLNPNANHHGSGGFVSGSNSSKHPLAKTFSLMFQNGGVEAALSSASGDGSPQGGDDESHWGAFESA